FAEQSGPYEKIRKACEDMKADVVSIRSEEERKFIHDLVKHENNTGVWLSALKEKGKSKFSWTDGSDVVFTYWAHGRPNNLERENRTCICFSRSTSYWFDVNCDTGYYQMCEIFSGDFIINEMKKSKLAIQRKREL
ncbi:hypothetical protein B4U80_12664, partial [Leptotrombidium deliense]